MRLQQEVASFSKNLRTRRSVPPRVPRLIASLNMSECTEVVSALLKDMLSAPLPLPTELRALIGTMDVDAMMSSKRSKCRDAALRMLEKGTSLRDADLDEPLSINLFDELQVSRIMTVLDKKSKPRTIHATREKFCEEF